MKIFRILRLAHRLAVHLLFGGSSAARYLGATVGEKSRIYTMRLGSEPFLISVGNNVTISSGVSLITHDGSTSLVKTTGGARYQRYGRITIGNNVFIGSGSIILPGCNIADNVVIGAGSVVTKSILEEGVYAGSPARKLRDFDNFKYQIEEECASDDELDEFDDYEQKVHAAINIQTKKRLAANEAANS